VLERIPSSYSPAYSEVVSFDGPGRFVYVSGHVGVDGATGAVPQDDHEREAELCFYHVRRSLAKAGASMSDVVRITAYLTDLESYPAFAAARAEAFAGSPPASAAVQVAGLLLGAWLEVDAIAFVPAGGEG
jgi:2-iminobutanoate/2-iminopropanoate deaminase